MTASSEKSLCENSKRRISTSSINATAKDSLDPAFRYEKGRPRARTVQSSIKGLASRRSSLSSSSASSRLDRGKIKSGTDAGHRINSVKGSAFSIPVGPKSASSRISLERIREHHHHNDEQDIQGSKEAGHVGHSSGNSTSSSSSSLSSPSLAGLGPVRPGDTQGGHQQHVAARMTDGSYPRSSASSSNLNRVTATLRSAPSSAPAPAISGMAAASSPGRAASSNAVTTTTPRRIHIAPLRLVNPNGIKSGAYTATLPVPGLHSSSTNTSVNLASSSSSSASSWSYGTPAFTTFASGLLHSSPCTPSMDGLYHSLAQPCRLHQAMDTDLWTRCRHQLRLIQYILYINNSSSLPSLVLLSRTTRLRPVSVLETLQIQSMLNRDLEEEGRTLQ